MNASLARQRLDGLDLARWLALIGMVIVNFHVVMVARLQETNVWQAIAEMPQGRAAATFVVLAGIGFGLGAARAAWPATVKTTLKRVAFLVVLGLINQLVFDADIIHYYAFYFLFALYFLRRSSREIWIGIVVLIVAFVAMAVLFDYNTGWDWEAYAYHGFWTPSGFIRNLFFNGWHPVVPWLAFMLFGIWLARLDLGKRQIQCRLFVSGAAVLAAAVLCSSWLTELAGQYDQEAAILFTISPIPPMPLYMVNGFGAASMVIGASLLASPVLKRAGLLGLVTPAGRMTLTLYLAHILIGMGALQALDMLGNQNAQTAVLASIGFCFAATLLALVWSKAFKRGPLESLMRAIT